MAEPRYVLVEPKYDSVYFRGMLYLKHLDDCPVCDKGCDEGPPMPDDKCTYEAMLADLPPDEQLDAEADFLRAYKAVWNERHGTRYFTTEEFQADYLAYVKGTQPDTVWAAAMKLAPYPFDPKTTSFDLPGDDAEN